MTEDKLEHLSAVVCVLEKVGYWRDWDPVVDHQNLLVVFAVRVNGWNLVWGPVVK